MARNGSGTYTAPANSVNPAVDSTTIDSSDFNTLIDDMETALTESIARDGQTTTTAAIPFASGITSDTIAEETSNTGVTIDGTLIKDGTINSTQVNDTNGNEVLILGVTASAVNEVTITNAATGNAPSIRATGEVDIGFEFQNSDSEEILVLASVASAANELTIVNAATGNTPIVRTTGESDIGIQFQNSDSEEILVLASVATAVNELTVTNAATGNAPQIAATGETNVDLNLVSAGTGVVQANGATVVPTLGTAATTTSGTEWDWTIPSWAKRITISFNSFSMSGTSPKVVRVGHTSGTIVTTGYTGAVSTTLNAAAVSAANLTPGFNLLPSDAASDVVQGQMTLILIDAAAFVWGASWQLSMSNSPQTMQGAGIIDLSAALDTVRVTSTGGSDTGDSGSVNVLYE